MAFEWMLLTVVMTSALSVLLVLAGFWVAIVRPYLDGKVDEIIKASKEIEPGVKRGVQEGIEDTLREFPEATLKESTRQFRRFGSGLFENGLSSFLGEAPDRSRNKSEE